MRGEDRTDALFASQMHYDDHHNIFAENSHFDHSSRALDFRHVSTKLINCM